MEARSGPSGNASPDDSSEPRPAPAEAELRTFLIADIRGYTSYTEVHGSDAAANLAGRFASIVRDVVRRHDGTLLELRGDEALAVFVLARRALRAAVELQARVAPELPRGVGIGLDAGEATPVEGGYRGAALNIAARLCAHAGPGETLASETVIHLAARVEGVGYVDARTYRMKGLAAPIRAVHVVPADRGSPRPLRYGGDRRPDRRLLAAGGISALAVALVAVGLSGAFDGVISPRPTAPVASATASATTAGLLGRAELPLIAFIDPATGEVTDTKPVHGPTDASEFRDGAFWLLTLDPFAFRQIDASSHETTRSVSIPLSQANGSWIDDDTIWFTDVLSPRVVAVDVPTGVLVEDFPIALTEDQALSGLTMGDGSLWVSVQGDEPGDGQIIRLDPTTGEEQTRISQLDFPEVLTFGEGAVWFTGAGAIGRIDPQTDRVTFTTELGTGEGDQLLPYIAFAGGSAWTANDEQGKVWKVDRSGRSTEFDVGAGSRGLSLLDDTMWVAVQDAGKLVGIDVTTGEREQIDIGHLALSVAADGDELMVAVDRTPEERIAALDGAVLTIASPSNPFFASDPATNGSFELRQLEHITCASLLRYPDAPAPEGWELVPEVAAEMPEISADGRTYTFTIREGFTFSPPSDEVVTADTYRFTIERALSPDLESFFAQWLSDIDGAEAYMAGDAPSLTGVRADGDLLTIQLTEPSSDFLKRLSLPYFCPVPIGTPVVPGGLDAATPLSAAGPYYMKEHYGGDLLIVERNPHYTGDRERPWDAIAWRVGFSASEVIARVENGLADAATGSAFDDLMNAQSDRAQRWGPTSDAAAAGDQRWFGGPRFGVEFLFLNPARFLADRDVRRAVALAVDRTALATWFGEQPFHGLLAPSVPGSLPADTPVPPPDVDAAKELMRGRTGTIVMGVFEDCAECKGVAETVAGSLSPIGITVEVKAFDDLIGEAFAPESEIDVYNAFLDTDFPDPVSLLRQNLGENQWIGEAHLAELERIQDLEGQERIDAAAALATRLSDEEAYAIPYAYPIYPMYLGEGVGCGFVQPAIGAVGLLSLCAER